MKNKIKYSDEELIILKNNCGLLMVLEIQKLKRLIESRIKRGLIKKDKKVIYATN